MTVPVVAAFSASCSANATVAPRPATSAGSRAARVTTGPRGFVAGAASAGAGTRPVTTVTAAATAARRVARRAGGMLQAIGGLDSVGRRRGEATIWPGDGYHKVLLRNSVVPSISCGAATPPTATLRRRVQRWKLLR